MAGGARAALIIAAGLALAGCRVSTTVSVDATSSTAGTVSVVVTLDQSAVQSMGGLAALASYFSDSDLVAEGWKVTPPHASGSSVVIAASHRYASDSQAASLLASLAGSGPQAQRPFRLTVSHHHDFWHTYTDLTGSVDLRCGLGCFGDPGLKAALGYPNGVATGSLADPTQVFSIALHARLPGSVSHSNAASTDRATLVWNPLVGSATSVSALSAAWNGGSILLVALLASAPVVATVAILLRRWLRKRPRRHTALHFRLAGRGAGDGEAAGGEGAVTPPS